MTIHFDSQQWDRTKANYRKWWAGELDRPLIAVTVGGYEAARPEPKLPGQGFTSFYGPEVTADAIVDRWDSVRILSCR